MTINLTTESKINAIGAHIHGNNKPILCPAKGITFLSGTDAAKHAGVTPSTMSRAVRTGGKCKGEYYCFLSDRDQTYDIMTKRIQQTADYEEISAKAKAYDALMAEQERKLKEEERRNMAIIRTKQRIAQHEAKLAKETEMLSALQEELAQLEKGV